MSDNHIVNIEDATIFHHFKTILNNVNFQLKIGEFAYIIGETGSGKSSLLRTIYSDIPLKMGKIIVDGQDISNIKKNQLPYLRRKIGIIFQDFQLLMDRSVKDNLRFVMKATGWKGRKRIDDEIKKLLLKVDMLDKADAFPHLISGGEQQRIAVARALINDPEIILADEPTGNLDPETSKKIMSLIKSVISKEKTVIMATHDFEIINEFSGRIVKFNNKSISE